MSLIGQKEKQKREEYSRRRKTGQDSVKIYNTNRAMRCNPFAGDTTILDWSVDNRVDSLHLTEEEVLDSVLFAGKRYHVRKSDVRLHPDMVSEEIKDYYRAKISGSALRSAKNYHDKVL